MLEIDVTLTDYALSAVCFFYAWRLYKIEKGTRIPPWAAIFFLSVALSALIGGTSHGFFENETSLLYKILWKTTLILIAVTAYSLFQLSFILIASKNSKTFFNKLLSVLFILYVIVVFFISQTFWMAIAAYFPSILFLGFSSMRAYFDNRVSAYSSLFFGVTVSISAAFIQVAQISLHPVYFTHNALYHVVQIVGMYLFYQGFKYLLNRKPHD